MDDFDESINVISELRQHGVEVSMDDFGTGYSSLSLLRKLPIDELKIDKSFVDDIVDDDKAISAIKSIVTIAKGHDLQLVAEGVETEEQMSVLLSLGCEFFQGYLLHRPSTISEIESVL